MNATRAKRGFTIVELVVVIVIIVFLLALLMPTINAYREVGRRTTCMQNQKQVALAMQTFASTYNNSFPPSASLAVASDGTGTVGGYSFLVQLLPFLSRSSMYNTLPANGDPEDTSNPAIVAAMNTQMSEFLCPSSPRGSARPSAGITNYKAMGATTRGSLIMVANPQSPPPYGTMATIPGARRSIPMGQYIQPVLLCHCLKSWTV